MAGQRSSIGAFGVLLVLSGPGCGNTGGATDEGTGGADAAANGGEGGDDSGTFEELRAALEEEVRAHETDVPFTLILANETGTFFEASNEASSSSTVYESASTSKWVATATILHVVQTTDLELESRAADVLPFWTDDPQDWRSAVTLRHLLSFTSGMQPVGAATDSLCISLPGADFASCVESIYEDAGSRNEVPGTEFVYGSHHSQVAGLMAMAALGAPSFSDVFAAFRASTQLFPTSTFDLPSAENPRLAGGMHWTANEYMEFLGALFESEILTPHLLENIFADHTPESDVDMVESPAWNALEETWHYALGNWLECPLSAWQPSCERLDRFSSPGAYGAYPFLDFGQGYFGILAREGRLGSFRDGLEIYRDLSPLIEELAIAARR